ncbi:hypothetical protein [Actinophytocola sp.]|uniref:hypothetical protein n=1 Tax=Actinophytocola sp. TaxID=1872138 RepID=UPI002ED0AD0C
MTTARGLLEAIDGLSFRDRQRLLAVHGRRVAGTDELTRLLDDLHGSGEFARRIGLLLAGIAGERAHVERCLSGVETNVLRYALISAVRLNLPAAVLVDKLPELASAMRATLYQEVRRRRATELAEALLPVARARFGDNEAAALLPMCTPETVAAELPDLAYAVTGWRRLGLRHPRVFLDHVDTALATTPKTDWSRLLHNIGGGLAVTALTDPDRVLSVLERVVPYAPLPASLGRVMGALGRHDASRLLAVLTHPRCENPPGGRTLWRSLLGASDAELSALGWVLDTGQLPRFLRVLPPGRRTVVYTAAVGDHPPLHIGLPTSILGLLPAAARAEHGRRWLGTHAVADSPVFRLEVTAWLPWPEAREALLDATRRSSPDERAHAYQCLIEGAAASRDPDVFGDMLGLLSRLANDQDPVRQPALSALARTPPWLFRTADLALVTKLMTDATQARDCSPPTQQAVRELAVGLIREGVLTRQSELVDTGLRGLSALGQRRPWLDLGSLDHHLPRGGEHQVFEALRPRLERDARRGRFELALSLALGLGRRAWTMPGLQDMVGRARKAADDQVVRRAIELWLAPPATRDERLAEVFRTDRSTIVLPSVCHGIGWRRTDLLDEVFGKPLHGRFLKKSHRHVPGFVGGFQRWLPRQVAMYADVLGRVATAPTAQIWERVKAVTGLGALPGSADRLRAFLTNEDVSVVEAALGALARTDEPAEVLPDLLAHVDDDRARVAVYAATRCARFVPPDRLAEALAPALTARKVTSRKEAVRLLATHHAAGAVDLLTAAWAEPDQHHDVRRALVSAASRQLDDERVWPLLTESASAEHAVATALLDVRPQVIAERHRSRYAGLVRTVAGAELPDTARLGLAALPAWTRWDTASTALLVSHVTDLAGTATWHPALSTLITACATSEDSSPLLAVAAQLIDAADAADPPAEDRDLPARQRILELAKVVHWSSFSMPTLRRAAAELADALAGSPTLRRPALDLAISAVDLAATADDIRALVRVAELADTPRWAWYAHDALRTAVGRRAHHVPETHLYDLAEALVAHQPMLAVAVTGAAGEEANWPARWRGLIGRLRAHQDPDVRLAAIDTLTSRE